MSSISEQVEIAVLMEWKKRAEEHMKNTDAAIESLKKERTNALIWGTAALGATVLSLFGFIMMLFSDGRITK